MRKRGILLAAAVLLAANGCGKYEEVSIEPLQTAQTAEDKPGRALRTVSLSLPFPALPEASEADAGRDAAPREEKDG